MVPSKIDDDPDTGCQSSNIDSFIKKIAFQVKTEMSWRSGVLGARLVRMAAVVVILMTVSLAESKEVEARTYLDSVSTQ